MCTLRIPSKVEYHAQPWTYTSPEIIRIPEYLQVKLQGRDFKPHSGQEGEAPVVQPRKGTSPYSWSQRSLLVAAALQQNEMPREGMSPYPKRPAS